MATGSAIMSGVSAGQNISQIGQLNEMAESASAVAESAQQATSQAAEASSAVSNGTATTDQLAQTTESINKTMSQATDGVKSVTGKTVTKGFNEVSKSMTKSAKFGIDDVLQIGGAIQTAGSMIGSDNDGAADVRKDKKLRKFGTITRINSKKKMQKVNSVSADAYNSRRSSR